MGRPPRAEAVEALVLAGRRGGEDPVARASGVSHKALARLCGRPLLSYVIAALRQVPVVQGITVSIDDAHALRSHPEFGPALSSGAISLHASGRSPAESARDFIASRPEGAVLVTTGDHPLLAAATVRQFVEAAFAAENDLAVAVVPAAAVLALAPHSKRTWLRLGSERFTGANLFLAQSRGAAQVAAFWRKAERVRKEPWRLAALLGPVTLARFLAGRLSLESALDAVSNASGARIGAVRLGDGRAGIDVDKLEDLALAERLMRETSPAQRA